MEVSAIAMCVMDPILLQSLAAAQSQTLGWWVSPHGATWQGQHSQGCSCMTLPILLFWILQQHISERAGRKGSQTGEEHISSSPMAQGLNKWTHHHHCGSLAPLAFGGKEEPPWTFLVATSPACNSPAGDFCSHTSLSVLRPPLAKAQALWSRQHRVQGAGWWQEHVPLRDGNS